MTFKYYFNFLGLPEIGKIEVSEFFGFDGASHKVSQDEGRFGRDVIIGNEEIELTVTRGYFEKMSSIQSLQNGMRFQYASQGFDYLSAEITNKGWECEVEVILEKDGTQFVTGIVDGYTAIVLEDEIKFKVIQNTKREEIKRREDIYVNAFSDKDLDGNTIAPCQTTNILLKAKPIQQNSKWVNSTNVNTNFVFYGQDFAFISPVTNLVTFGIEDSFVPFEQVQQTGSFPPENELQEIRNELTYVRAKFELTNAVITLKNVNLLVSTTGFSTNTVLTIGYGTNYQTGQHTTQNIFQSTNPVINVNQDFTFTIPNLPAGGFIYAYVAIGSAYSTPGGTPVSSSTVQFSCDEMTIQTTSTAIDSVIKGVRLIDLMKHTTKSVGNVPLIAPDYDNGGEHYDNFTFNGYLLSQIIDKPFNNKFSDIVDIPKEICGDYQINPTNVEIKTFDKFYDNVEIGAFLELPDENNNSIFNKRFFLKEYWMGYSKSSEARENNGENTIDDIHTDSQWMFDSKKTDGNLRIQLKHIRSAYLIEEQRKRATQVSEKSTSLQNDESLFLLDCVRLAPGSRNEFTAVLTYRTINSTQIELLSNGTFNWTLLGFNVGATITLISGGDTHNYTVAVLKDFVITLTTNEYTPTGSGTGSFTVNYPLSNVTYTNRGDEGFTSVTGVFLPTKYSNLNYSIKRNIQRWFPYLATAGKYIPNRLIKNTLFRINGELRSQKVGEIIEVVDRENISINDIAEQKILNPIIHKVTVYSEFDTATQLFEDVQNLKGFVRVQLNTNDLISGYPKELDYEWSTNKLTLTLEEKFVSDFVEITGSAGTITLNGINYTGVSYKINNNFVSLYDSNDILINKIVRFEQISINGVNYTNSTLFSDALTQILT